MCICLLWIKYRKAAMQRFIVSYKNAFRITHSLSMRCISSAIFVSTGAACCNTMFVEYMYSLMCLISASANSTVDRIMHSDVYNISGLRRKSFSAIYTLSVYLYFSLWA